MVTKRRHRQRHASISTLAQEIVKLRSYWYFDDGNMSLPKKLQEKYLQRFDGLITEGERIQKAIQKIPGEYDPNYTDSHGHTRPTRYIVDADSFIQWRTSCTSLVDQVLPKEQIHRKTLEGFWQADVSKAAVEGMTSIMRGLRDDFAQGILGNLARQVEAEIAGDYMGQAEQLLQEGTRGKFDHVPAAVLAGAVMEKTLRLLCEKQNPPISVFKPNGEPKTMNPMIDDLKIAGLFVETKAKQLRGWAGIRNDAAHGDFDKFTRADVELMLKGIENFLAEFC